MNIFLLVVLLITTLSISISLFAVAIEGILVCIAVAAISFLTWRIRRDTNDRSTSD